MKSIFKSFALVAAAAMAFTACQNDIEVTTGGGDVEATTTVHVVANLNSTRSAFGDKIDAGYTSHWNGGEVAKAYVVSDGGFDNYYNVSASTPATVVAQDGAESATIDLAFSGTLSSGVLYIVTAADGSVVDCAGTGYNYYGGQKPVINIPTEQTPDKDGKSVDPKAHILIYQDESFRPSELNSLEVNFSHYAAYGKLNLRNAPEGVESYVLDINGNKYIINSSRTTDVWFACEPAVVVNMSVTVNTAAGAYTKKIVDNGSRALEFVKGAVSKFTVNMEGVTTGEEVDTFNPDVRANEVVWNKEGYFAFSDFSNSAFNYLYLEVNEANRPNNNSLLLGDYTYGKNENQFRIKYNNGVVWSYSDSSGTMNVSFVDGNYIILINVTSTYNEAFKGTFGYKGVPEGWVAPAGGSDNTGGGDNTGGDDNTGDDNTGDSGVDVSGYNPVQLVSVAQGKVWGTIAGNHVATFEFSDEYLNTLKFDLCNLEKIDVANKSYAEGVYTFANEHSDSTPVVTNLYYTDIRGYDGSKAIVYKSGDVYTIKVELCTQNNNILKFYYQGTL